MANRQFIAVMLMAAFLAGCNNSSDVLDVSSVKDKVDHPLPKEILNRMAAKDMPKNSPIMIRIFKEEGVLEIWKAKTNNRFDKIAEYQICAWSGRLGPKVKEGDRQAPEGFYPLSRANLNPYSKYFLAINTGYPNTYDRANARSGSNLMIHGACSSSGCYSMTDAQILEIFGFARDAFAGGQTSIQLQAFPFRMTPDNMARHRMSPYIGFWNMLKVGYDQFEVTKRPPEVNVCEKKYVFNQQPAEGSSFSSTGACPPMSTPPALSAALADYNKTYDVAYAKALRKYDGLVWYDPTEAERKALVAEQRKGRDLAYAPTGSALKAGKLMKVEDLEAKQEAQEQADEATAALKATTTVPVPQLPPPQAQAAAPEAQTAAPATSDVADADGKKPFWKRWFTK
jgi:murein L,D-transpeptidase YafK